MVPGAEGFDRLLRRVDDAEPTRPIGGDDLGVILDPEAAGVPRPEPDVNDDDNAADWSRART
jgi:hypothetical protein